MIRDEECPVPGLPPVNRADDNHRQGRGALTDGGKQFEYRMVLRSRDPKSAESLSQYLRKLPQVIEFRISPTGD